MLISVVSCFAELQSSINLFISKVQSNAIEEEKLRGWLHIDRIVYDNEKSYRKVTSFYKSLHLQKNEEGTT